ncbi:hypothetical protein ACIPOR_15110 [Photobacterium damselae subsp. piscicida]
MSNKPRKKKNKPTKKCRPVQASSAFDSYEQYETTMDNVIQLLRFSVKQKTGRSLTVSL